MENFMGQLSVQENVDTKCYCLYVPTHLSGVRVSTRIDVLSHKIARKKSTQRLTAKCLQCIKTT